MNQILVTEKLYVTPELKQKKKVYKFNFIISIFLVIVLASLYVYAEYDRNKGEQTSKQILKKINQTLTSTEKDSTILEDDILLVILDETEENNNQEQEKESEALTVASMNEKAEVYTSSSGYRYKIIAKIEIPKINLTYSVLQGETGSVKETEELLKISPIKFHGYDPNEIGNFCIAGHNYRNSKFFSKVPTLEVGDIVKLTDLTKRTITYEVYDIHSVEPNNRNDTTQLTGGKKEVTLITCTDDSKERIIVKCREVK